MKYFISLFLLLLSFSMNAQDSDSLPRQRKKVAVVLSGGGAKGVAHVPVLKAIERAGIPIDIIVGTSMGSLVGGLYAYGYNADQLDSIVKAQDWMDLLMDKKSRTSKQLVAKQHREKYIVSVSFDKSPFEVMQGGVLKGNKVGYLLSKLTADRLDSISYDDLPIRYACVSTDLVTGNEVDMHSGILAESMRSSMAIPGVFSPIKKGKMALVDGGLCNNYPVDVARRMGADIVIGVSVSDNLLENSQINTPIDQLMQLMGVMCSQKLQDNIADTDLFFHVDVAPYTAASFTSSAIDTLLQRGKIVADQQWEKLIALRKVIGLDDEVKSIDKPRYIQKEYADFQPVPTIYSDDSKESYVGLGARFDNEELASILVGGSYQFRNKMKSRVGLNLRLGKRMSAEFDFSIVPWEKWNVAAKYKLSGNDLEVYDRGNSCADLRFAEHFAKLNFFRSWKMMKVSFGAEYTYRKYSKVHASTDWLLNDSVCPSEGSLAYYAKIEYDNMNEALYPTRGMCWSARYSYYTDNGWKFGQKPGLHIVEAYFKIATSITPTTTLIPSVALRFSPERNTHVLSMNAIGGVDVYGHYLPQQMAFAGVNHIQFMPNDMAILGLIARQRLTKNNYVFGVFNYGAFGQDLEHLFDQNKYGAALGYGYRSPVGPLEANINWSSITKSVGAFVNIGFMF